MGSTTAIEAFFSDYFKHWGIVLPARAVAARSAGHVFEGG
jgi:hypothetical protein